MTAPSDSILIVDDDPGMIAALGRMLRGLAELRFAVDGADGLRMARDGAPDLILLDAQMPGMSGFQLIELLKADAELARVPVIFVTSHSEPAFEVAGFELGAADFVAKPVNAALLMARVRAQLRHKRVAEKLRRHATFDPLTELPNRRRFDEALHTEWLRSLRSAEPLAVLTVDIDHFRRFNARHGEPAGDACLRAIGRALLGAGLRPADLVARLGSDEFALLLPQTPRSGAEHMAHRVLDAVEALAIPHADSPLARHVTVSVGIACHDAESRGWLAPSNAPRSGGVAPARPDAADVVLAATQALRVARQAGGAQARLLDLADLDTPGAARDIQPAARPPRARRPSANPSHLLCP